MWDTGVLAGGTAAGTFVSRLSPPYDGRRRRSQHVRAAVGTLSSGIGAIPCSIFSYVASLAQACIAPGSLPFVGTWLVGSSSLARLTQEPHLLEAPAEEHRANANNVRNRS